jgi:hypothetical protein
VDRSGCRRGYHTARVCSWIDVLRTRCSRKLTTGCLSILQKLQTLCNGNIAGLKLCCTGICVDGVRDLIVAAFVQIKPDFGDIGIDADSTRISINTITILVDLEIEDADRAPEGRIATILVDSLLAGFICLVILLTSQVRSEGSTTRISVETILEYGGQ